MCRHMYCITPAAHKRDVIGANWWYHQRCKDSCGTTATGTTDCDAEWHHYHVTRHGEPARAKHAPVKPARLCVASSKRHKQHRPHQHKQHAHSAHMANHVIMLHLLPGKLAPDANNDRTPSRRRTGNSPSCIKTHVMHKQLGVVSSPAAAVVHVRVVSCV